MAVDFAIRNYDGIMAFYCGGDATKCGNHNYYWYHEPASGLFRMPWSASDNAMTWLEKAYENREGNLLYIGRPIWDPLRDDPRFRDLLRRMNLPAGDKK